MGRPITVDLGYQQQAKLDLSSVANEKMTLVHIGEKLVILFDNNATVTVEPFFNSMGVPRFDLTVEVTPGRELTGGQFATVFPITTDQSVLPAAGTAQTAPASGANFSDPSVEPLFSPDPLPLLGPEELPNWVVNFETIPLQEVELPVEVEEAPPPNPALNITKAVSSVTDGPDAFNSAGVDGAGDVINYTITGTEHRQHDADRRCGDRSVCGCGLDRARRRRGW